MCILAGVSAVFEQLAERAMNKVIMAISYMLSYTWCVVAVYFAVNNVKHISSFQIKDIGTKMLGKKKDYGANL